jgi:hypothetical protein
MAAGFQVFLNHRVHASNKILCGGTIYELDHRELPVGWRRGPVLSAATGSSVIAETCGQGLRYPAKGQNEGVHASTTPVPLQGITSPPQSM